MDALIPAAAFSWSLKTCGDVAFCEGNKKKVCHTVFHFDGAKFIVAFSPSSLNYNADLCNYEDLKNEMFEMGETWG